MIEVERVEEVKDCISWCTNLHIYCKMPLDVLNRLKTVDTDVLSQEIGRDLLEQLVAHMMKMQHVHLNNRNFP